MKTLLRFALLFVLAAAAYAQTPAAPAGKQPVATIGGQPVYEDDLLPVIQPQLQQLRNQEYELKQQALERVVQQKLIEAEATKKGVPADKLLVQEVDAKIPEPSDGEIEAFYLGQRERINRPLAEVKEQLKSTLMQARSQQRRRDYFDRLRQQAHVVVLLRPPRVEVALDPARLRGNPQAPVTIVEFSDFQCPYCQRAQDAIRRRWPNSTAK